MSTAAPATLHVWLDGTKVDELTAGGPPFAFGRARECDLRLGSGGRQGDRHIPRVAGAVHAQWGYWAVDNVGSVPLEILSPVQDWLVPGSTWAIGPDGFELRVTSPIRPFAILLQPKGHGAPLLDRPAADPDGDPTTYPLPDPSRHERTLLTAKFLGRRRPGFAIGNGCAAERLAGVGYNDLAAERLGKEGYRVTGKAVEDCARLWKERLEAIGVTGIDGRENVNRLGCALLRYGVIRQQDALGLPPVEEDGG